MDESQADGESGPERSFPLSFDPVAGMRAVADIQAEGLRAAGELLERMLRAEPDGPGPRRARRRVTTRRWSTPGRSCCGAPSPGWLRPAVRARSRSPSTRAASARRCA